MTPLAKKRLIDWATFLLWLNLALLILLNANTDMLRRLRSLALDLSMGVEARLTTVSDFLHALQENQRLREENVHLMAEVALLKQAALENRELRRMLHLTPQLPFAVKPAEIVSKDITRQKNTFVINVGKADGIDVDMAVTDTRGVLGRTILVGQHYALVQSYLNTDFRLSVEILPDQVMGILEWDGTDPEQLILRHVSRTAPVHSGQEVVTSGFSNVFPKGIPVGTIHHIIRKPGNQELTLFVHPAASLSQARHVFVVLDRPDAELQHIRRQMSR